MECLMAQKYNYFGKLPNKKTENLQIGCHFASFLSSCYVNAKIIVM